MTGPATGPEPLPRWPEELREVAAELDERFRATPVWALLGARLDAWGPGWAQASLVPRPEHGNLAGSTHGGVLFTLADAVFEVACNAHGRLSVALETTCHYTAPAPIGELVRAEAVELSRSRRTGSYRLSVTTADGASVATYLALAYRTGRWHVDPSRLPEGWVSDR